MQTITTPEERCETQVLPEERCKTLEMPKAPCSTPVKAEERDTVPESTDAVHNCLFGAQCKFPNMQDEAAPSLEEGSGPNYAKKFSRADFLPPQREMTSREDFGRMIRELETMAWGI
uniref:GAGE domain-containing protein n=1 Tax=Panagrellus redivivus TaxID=6233 RepID=A0A7E4VP25_PANRE